MENQGPFIPDWTFADKLRKARQTSGLGQREFAEKLGVTASAYQQWEAGNNMPRVVLGVARRVQLLTGVSAVWLLGFDAPTPQPAGPAMGDPGAVQPTDCTVGVVSLDDWRGAGGGADLAPERTASATVVELVAPVTEVTA